jgi:predicted aspartyl protease
MLLELANHRDQILADEGVKPADEIRRLELDGWVDTGAARLVLPQEVANALGLPKVGTTGVRFADGRKSTRDVVGDVWLRMLGRAGVFTAIVEPGREDALIGAIVLEELDMIADPVDGTCRPRDPDMVVSEIE